MTFSSLVFICIFLPIVYLLHTLLPSIRLRNALLIAASLVFYAFGEPVYVLLMLVSATVNYLCALAMGRRVNKAALLTAVIVNIGFLFLFKYTGFLVENLNRLLRLSLPVPQIPLPIGISFFTFQALSYVIDVYRGDAQVQRSFPKLLLYISFFPQLIAGPIVKYRDVAEQIEDRDPTLKQTALGLRRFLFGLAKKVLIANAMAVTADALFNAPLSQLDTLSAWLGGAAYTLQIYFDFSAYSDMAIGLGRMFGFRFRENFNFPYGAVTIKEFWRRWHISLSSWFKDYVYIPLGGNRRGRLRTALNKLIVFFLTGLWHGANWTFVVWGLFHGLFSFLEEFIPAIRKLPRFLGHIYTMLVVTVGFVIFRSESIGYAIAYLQRMFVWQQPVLATMSLTLQQLTPYFLVMLLAAVLFCAPLGPLVRRLRAASRRCLASGSREAAVQRELYAVSFVLLLWCLIRLSGGSYNPFIYFRF